jgi:hypothetical protein
LTNQQIKLHVFECEACLYHGWYQIVDGNRYSEDDAKFEQYECWHATNPLVLEGTTGFSYADLVQPMKRPYGGIFAYLLQYSIILSTKNMFKVFANMKEKELKGAMEKLDKLKDCGNLFFISEWTSFITETTPFVSSCPYCFRMETATPPINLSRQTPCGTYQFATLPLGWTTSEWQSYMMSGTVSPKKSADYLWKELLTPVPPLSNPLAKQQYSSTAAAANTTTIPPRKRKKTSEDDNESNIDIDAGAANTTVPLREKKNTTEDDNERSADIDAGVMTTIALKSNANDDYIKPEQTMYNFARGIKNEKDTCWLQSILISLAQS